LDGVDRFYAARARNIKEATISKYRVLLSKFVEVRGSKGITYLSQIDLPTLREFRETWSDARYRRTRRLNGFGPFLSSPRVGWILTNVAQKVQKPIVEDKPTLPFTDEEWGKTESISAREASQRERRIYIR
jgi:hypothetical protein